MLDEYSMEWINVYYVRRHKAPCLDMNCFLSMRKEICLLKKNQTSVICWNGQNVN